MTNGVEATGRIDDLWHLADSLSICEAAALIAGYDPNIIKYYYHDSEFAPRFHRYLTAESSIKNAVSQGTLKANIGRVPLTEDEVIDKEQGYSIPKKPICIDRTIIKLEDLKEWIKKGKIKASFFLPDTRSAPKYLDKENEHYAPKLAAAIHAWEAVSSNPILTDISSPKQALAKWLRDNAVEFGLTHDDGALNEAGISEISKVANWKLKGGAQKTPER